mmetsp:Transcript_9440/g.36848  ORF Transcript_9440/g.36848 Transcript_9440/m.36848 type:complete len:476 (-) Transcript_9440:608-2035(-)
MVIDPWRSCRLPRDSRAHRKQMGPDCPGGAPHQFGRSKQAACEAGPSRQSALQPTQRRLASAEGRAATTRTGTAFQAKRGRVGAAADELVAGGRGRRTPPGEGGGRRLEARSLVHERGHGLLELGHLVLEGLVLLLNRRKLRNDVLVGALGDGAVSSRRSGPHRGCLLGSPELHLQRLGIALGLLGLGLRGVLGRHSPIQRGLKGGHLRLERRHLARGGGAAGSARAGTSGGRGAARAAGCGGGRGHVGGGLARGADGGGDGRVRGAAVLGRVHGHALGLRGGAAEPALGSGGGLGGEGVGVDVVLEAVALAGHSEGDEVGLVPEQLDEAGGFAAADVDGALREHGEALGGLGRLGLADGVDGGGAGLVNDLKVADVAVALAADVEHAGVVVPEGHEDARGLVELLLEDRLRHCAGVPHLDLAAGVAREAGGDELLAVPEEDHVDDLGALVSLHLADGLGGIHTRVEHADDLVLA